jgi:hypothetical protein
MMERVSNREIAADLSAETSGNRKITAETPNRRKDEGKRGDKRVVEPYARPHAKEARSVEQEHVDR